MGYRTHLNLHIQGENKLLVLRGKGQFENGSVEQIVTKKFPTNILLLNNYCIGKYYFDELPESLKQKELEIESPYIFTYESTNDFGEISVETLIAILKKKNKINKETKNTNFEWYYLDEDNELLNDLNFWMSAGIITPHSIIKFEVY